MSNQTAELPEMGKILPLVFGFAISQIAGTTSRLGVPKLLSESAKTVAELVAETGTDPRYMSRLLHGAAAVGMLERTTDGRYALSPTGRIYLDDAPWQASVHDAWYSHPAVWQAFGALDEAVRAGKPSFNLVHGTSFFDYLARDPQLADNFHRSMATNTTSNHAPIIENYDFSRFAHVVDVGGGNGALVASILAAHPELRGTVFDTALAVADAPSVLHDAGVSDRCDVVAGDFFKSLPQGADAYLLKNVLCDWDDESCVRILEACRRAMSADARVVVLDSLVPEEGTTGHPDEVLAAAVRNAAIMVVFPGLDRTLAEFERLFAAAGFKVGEVKPLHSSFTFHAIEALPA
ncbi:MAG TPA: methyltransferase [Micromonosporaceae bacterium]|nr:methyltransferase [Micromonosporaceae bacterium]